LRLRGLAGDRLQSFVAELQASLQWRAADKFRVSEDILTHVEQADRNGDADEAVWRAFLAAHFGRASAKIPGQLASAARLLCGFSDQPQWTWERVSAKKERFSEWLDAHKTDLDALSFGNHRK